jgi:carotenoid cleavage dioxygenase-like enzyme
MNVEKLFRYSFPKDAIEFHADEPTIAYIVDLKTGSVTTIETENVFTMHHVNAYEEDEHTLLMDLVSFPDASLVTFYEMNNIMNKTRRDSMPFKPSLRRYRIDLKAQKITPTTFDINPRVPHVNMLGIPTINEHYRSKHYCYVYGVVLKSDNKIYGNFSFVKKDLCNSTGDLSWSIQDHYPVEGWFVPDPKGTVEDDGVLMVPVLDGNLEKSYLLILDPKTMKPITKAYLPIVVPFHFHGRFVENVY